MLDTHLARWYGRLTGKSPSQLTFFYCHKSVLVLAAILVCFYAFLVVQHAQAVPDFGLRTAFGTDIIRKFDWHFRPVGTDKPEIGDVITQFGDQPISIWPQLLQEMTKLTEQDQPQEVAHLPTDFDNLTHVRMADGEELIRVRYQNRLGHGQTVWCLVDRAHYDSLLPSVLWFLVKGGLFFVALLVYWSRPHDRSAALFFWLSIITVGAYMGGYHWWRIVTRPELLLIFMVSAILVPAASLHFFCVFPRPKRLLQRRPLWALLAIYLVPLVFLAAIVASYLNTRMLVHSDRPDIAAIKQALASLLTWILVYLGVAGLWYLASVACLVHGYVTAADQTERNQVKCILFGSVAALAPIGYSLYLAFWEQQDFGSGAAAWPMFAASVCFTLAFAVSITRYRLMQLDQVLSSGMVYFLISFLAGLLYYAVVFIGMILIGGRLFSEQPSFRQALLVSTTALVLTLLLDLARSRIKKVLDRRFHRDKSHLDRTLQQMGQALEQLVDPPTLARRLLRSSSELVGAGRGAIYLREGHPPLYRLADALGERPPLEELAPGCPLIDAMQTDSGLRAEGRFPADPAQAQLRFLGGEVAQALTHEGHLMALLILGTKDAGIYTPEDLNSLAALAQITALALENAERHRTIDGLNRDLQGKVDKISEQQRRIMALQSQLLKGAAQPADNGAAEPKSPPPVPEETIVGGSPAIRDLLALIKKVSLSQSAVLLRGESGTGKELLARALHEHSPRAGKPFVKVHCAALSPGLLESELFGHVKGAFTGAHRDKVGRFELANGGTLFLDEIGDINPETQTKLLRVLQEMTFERVGSSEPVKVDVRVVAATHQDLERLIKEGRFREDLYYRLNVIAIHVPALRERREDIAELALHFLRLYAARSGKPVIQLDDDALAALKGYDWPGNIRQLENVIERAVVVAEGPSVTLAELPPEVHRAADGLDGWVRGPYRARHTPLVIGRGKHEDREQRERERLVRALAQAKGNKAEAARALGLARSTLLSRLKRHGLS